MLKPARSVAQKALEANNWTKFTLPTAGRGKTAFRTKPSEQTRCGIRYDFDGTVTRGDQEFNKFNIQPNAGKDIPHVIKEWREQNGGTHAIMATMEVNQNGTKEDVEEALDEAHKKIKMQWAWPTNTFFW